MKKRIHLMLIAVFAAVAGLMSFAPPRTPNQMISSLTTKMNLVKDYSASVRIKADIPMIKAIPVKAKVYFKQKDKFKVESKSIVILPKQGLSDLSATLSDTNAYTAVASGTAVINKVSTNIISVIPSSETGDMILGKFWIDDAGKLLMKSQITTRSSGTVEAEYFYGTQKKYGLPDSMVFTVDVKKFKIPKGVAVDIQKSGKKNTKTGNKGKIYIKISDYAINKGIPDDKFKK